MEPWGGHASAVGGINWKAKMFFVYILKNGSGKHYMGCTNNLRNRLIKHNSNKNKYTKNKGPWEIIYFEKINDKKIAFAREKQIKKHKGGEALKKLIRRGGRAVECVRLESVYTRNGIESSNLSPSEF